MKIAPQKLIKQLCFFISVFVFHFSIPAQSFDSIAYPTQLPSYTPQQAQELKTKVILEGDKKSLLGIERLPLMGDSACDRIQNRYELTMPYLLIMSNRYNSPYACYRIFTETAALYEAYNLPMDTGTLKFMLYHLEKGATIQITNEMDGFWKIACIRTLYSIFEYGIYGTRDPMKANALNLQYIEICKEVGFPPLEIPPPKHNSYEKKE